MRRVHGVYWASYEMGSLLRRGQAICNWVYLLYLLFCKAAIVNFIKVEFLRNTIYFIIQSHLLKFPSILLLLRHLTLTSKMFCLYDLRNVDFHFFSGTRKTELKARSFIYYLRYPFIKMGVCLLKYNLSPLSVITVP